MMRLSVCLGCGAVFPFKEIDKVVGIFEARFQRDFMYFHSGGKKQIFCGFHSFFILILEGREAEGCGKLVADPVFAHVAALFQVA